MKELVLMGGGRWFSLEPHSDGLRVGLDSGTKRLAMVLDETQEDRLFSFLKERRDAR